MVAPNVVSIRSEPDIIAARMAAAAREVARRIGFGAVDQARIATTASELARNILLYADEGCMVVQTIGDAAHHGIEMVFEDHGPGIIDPNHYLRDTLPHTTIGLAGARRLMDEIEIVSERGVGTRVVCRKWLQRAESAERST